VYVSGANDRNTKCPFASVVVVVFCDGADAVTVALATGAPDVESTTLPLNPPVVPASAHVPWASIATAKRAETNTCRNLFDFGNCASK